MLFRSFSTCVQRPALVIQVENRRYGHKIQIRLVIGVNRSHVAPVGGLLLVFIAEVVGKNAMLPDDAGKNVFAEVVAGLGILGIGKEHRNHELGIENVDAHRGIAMSSVVRRFLGRSGFFLEADDAPILVHFDNAELAGGLRDGNLNRGDGDLAAGICVLLEHLGVVHLVDVIAGKNKHEFGALAADGVDVLINGVRRALIPGLRNAHLRGNHFDVFAEAGERRPAGANVAVQAERFVLGEDENAAQVGVDAVGKRDVNDAVKRAEGHRGLGAVARERPKAFPLASGKKYGDSVLHGCFGHEPAPKTLM